MENSTRPRARAPRGTPETLTPMTARGRARTHPKPPSNRLAEVKARRQRFNEETRFFVLNGAQLRISIDLAREIGDRESIMLLQYEFWLATEGIQVGDKRAVHDSYRTLHRFFSFWSYATTQRTFDSLVEQGLLFTTPTPGGRNDGRYVFINFEKARTLKSIVVAQSPTQGEPQDVPVPVPQEEVFHSDTPASNPHQVYHSDTPSSFLPYQSDTPASHLDTAPFHPDTRASQVDTPAAPSYKERARAEEKKEKSESGDELGAPHSAVSASQPNSTRPAPTSENPFPNEALRALFDEPDVQVLLTVFGFNTARPDTLGDKDWEVLPRAVEFMRRENIEGGELRAFSHIANMRWSLPPYLSQLETHFYRLLPGRARAKSRQLEATQNGASEAPTPRPQGTPVFSTPPADELLDTRQEKRRRILRACANVFLNLPESEQLARREEAVRTLSSLEKDRYLRDLGFGREQSFGITQSWRENLFKGVWLDHRPSCDAQLAGMAENTSTDIGADELGSIPAIASFLTAPAAPTEELAAPPPAVPADSAAPASWSTGERMAGVGDVAGALMKDWRPQTEKQA